MTEEQWLTSTSPFQMLEFVSGLDWTVNQGHSNDFYRKIRLFMCGVCRLVEKQLTSAICKEAIEVGEDYAYGGLAEEERRKFFEAQPKTDHPDFLQSQLTMNCVFPNGWEQWRVVSEIARNSFGLKEEKQAALVRCLFGNPLRPLFSSPRKAVRKLTDGRLGKPPESLILDLREILRWNDRTIPRLAQQIQDERAWERLSFVADAMEEAGCPTDEECGRCKGKGGSWGMDSATQEVEWSGCFACNGRGRARNPLLSHLRSREPHTLGCFALELLLPKPVKTSSASPRS